MSASNPSTGRKRLDSWKEIAAFFGRDERTANRWEKELGLPIHRLPGTKGRVYAYTEELSAWSAEPKNAGAALPGYDSAGQPGLRASGLTVIAGRRTSVDEGSLESPSSEEVRAPSAWRHRNTIRLLTVAFLGLGALALDYFMQAIVHDPNYSQAYVGLADCYNLLREYTLMPSNEAYPRALAAAKKAVELDDQSSEAHASLAFVSFFGMWDIATGEREFRRAIDLNPNNAAPHHWYANALLALHRLPEALAEIDRAQALDPASSAILADKGNILGAAGRRDEALSLLKQMESRDPSFRSPHLYLKGVCLRNRDYPDYISELRKDTLLVHDDSALAIATAAEKGFAAGGARGMFKATLQVQKKLYAQNSLPPTALAATFAMLGNKTEALRYLKTAYEQRDSSLLFVEIYFEFNNLHDEPAYRDLLARMNLPVENAS